MLRTGFELVVFVDVASKPIDTDDLPVGVGGFGGVARRHLAQGGAVRRCCDARRTQPRCVPSSK
jgi:hypothetical protein